MAIWLNGLDSATWWQAYAQYVGCDLSDWMHFQSSWKCTKLQRCCKADLSDKFWAAGTRQNRQIKKTCLSAAEHYKSLKKHCWHFPVLEELITVSDIFASLKHYLYVFQAQSACAQGTFCEYPEFDVAVLQKTQ